MYEDITPESIKAEIIGSLETDINTGEGSFINNIISPVAYSLWKVYGEFDKILDTMFMETSDGDFVVRRCAEEGIYRREGTKATGDIIFDGSDGTFIPEGTMVQTDDGLEFRTTGSGTISDGEVLIKGESTHVGTLYNVPAGAIKNMVINIPGVMAVSNNAFENGTDPETIEELKARYLAKKRTSPASGNAADYIMWATEVSGVSNARVLPLWDGAGTVKVVLIGQGNTTVGSEIIEAAEANIESKKPIGATVTVVSASAVTINVSATINISGVSVNDVKTALTLKIKDYFSKFKGDKVYLTKIGALLMEIDGVTNYSNLKLNSGTSDISISNTQVPALGTVTLTGGA